MDVGSKIREARKKQNFSQIKVAKDAGIAVNSLIYILTLAFSLCYIIDNSNTLNSTGRLKNVFRQNQSKYSNGEKGT